MKFFDVTADPEVQRLPLLRRNTTAGPLPPAVEAAYRLATLLRSAARASGNDFVALAVSARVTGLVDAAEDYAQGGGALRLRKCLDELVAALLEPSQTEFKRAIEAGDTRLVCGCLAYLKRALLAEGCAPAGLESLCSACSVGEIGRCNKPDHTPCCFQQATSELLQLLNQHQ